MSIEFCPQCGQDGFLGLLGGDLFHCVHCTKTFACIDATERGWPPRPREEDLNAEGQGMLSEFLRISAPESDKGVSL